MSVVLSFCPAPGAAQPDAPRDRAPVNGTCEIIIFPGVRIEREAGTAPPSPTSAVVRARSMGGAED